jgi:hypothetical protein
MANWIKLDGLLRIKSRIAEPRHQEDARVLRAVKQLKRPPLTRRRVLFSRQQPL